MDRRKLMFGLAVVFGGFGCAFFAMPDVFFGTGAFYDRNFGPIRMVSIASLFIGALCLAVGLAMKRS